MRILTSVEHVVSKVLHLKDCGVRSAGKRSVEMRLDDFADDDVVIPLLNNGCYTTFDRTGSIDKNRSSGFALTERLPAELAVAHIHWSKERESEVLLFLAEHIEREGASCLHGFVSTGIRLDAHHHKGRSECTLGDPIDRRRRDVSFRVIRGENIDAIWDHPQNRFL